MKVAVLRDATGGYAAGPHEGYTKTRGVVVASLSRIASGTFESQSIRLWESQRQMLLKQLETLGMVHVPTCLGGPGLVWHSIVPDLPGPALAHHGLELGLASLGKP